MHSTNLRKVGGSIMLAIPPAIIDILNLLAGDSVGLVINHGRLGLLAAATSRRMGMDLCACCWR